jgi:hypothetical protein
MALRPRDFSPLDPAPFPVVRAAGSATITLAPNAIDAMSIGSRGAGHMRFLIRPLRDPESTLDLTDAVVEAIARHLALACGGNVVLNRLEASAHLESLLRRSSVAPDGIDPFSPLSAHVDAHRPKEETHAVVDSDEADRERQPQGFAVQRLALERAG